MAHKILGTGHKTQATVSGPQAAYILSGAKHCWGTEHGFCIHGQTNIEFMLVLIGVLLLSYVLILAYGGQLLNLLQSDNSAEGMKTAYVLASALNYVYLAGDGASYTFTFGIRDGTVKMYGGFVDVITQTGLSSAPVVTRNIISANVTHGNHTIRNVRGVITID